MGREIARPSAEMNELLVRSGSNDRQVAFAAQRELAKALTNPLKQGVLFGDTVGDIFEPILFAPGASIEFPLDFLSATNVKDFVAYTIPNQGRIPERHIEGDYITVQTYDVGASIDWLLKYARDARWDIVARALKVLEASFTRKKNNDAWHVLLAAAYDRNIVVYDADASAGFFTKRLVSLLKLSMRRNGGGNSNSVNRGRLTDLNVSPEAMEDVRNWNLTEIDDVTRREIYLASDNAVSRIFGVNMHAVDELGVGQEYQLYFTSTLGGSLQASDVELVVGLDLENRDSFVNPIRAEVEVFEDEQLHRQRRAGYYAWGEHGFAALSNLRVLTGSL
jgi:hypothetical protein